MISPQVSLITPSFNRQKYLIWQYNNLKKQSIDNFEWLILDDSENKSDYFTNLIDERVRYLYTNGRTSIGVKRNLLIEKAKSDIIMHIDDDDYYAPCYIEKMMSSLNKGFDLVKLSGFFLYNTIYKRFGYWDLYQKEGRCEVWSDKPIRSYMFTKKNNKFLNDLEKNGYGFSFLYYKKLAIDYPFEPINCFEDNKFINSLPSSVKLNYFNDETGLCVHVIHNYNTSNCFPQFILPKFMLNSLFNQFDAY